MEVPPDLIRIAVSIVASFPLGEYVGGLQSPEVKALASFLLGAVYLVALFWLPGGFALVLGASLLTYVISLKFAAKKLAPWVNFALQMALLLVSHCREQFGDNDYVNTIGITGTQMIAVQRLTSFMWDRFDGESLKLEKMEKKENERALREQPKLLNFLAYIFFFPTVMTGPAQPYAEFEKWLKTPRIASLKSSRRSAVIRLAAHGAVWAVLYALTAGRIDYEHLVETEFYIQSNTFMRLFWIYFSGLVYRTKYYAAWLLAEAACVASGVADGSPNFTAMSNVKPLSVELAQNFFAVFANWNIRTSEWLRHCVYIRVVSKGQRPGPLATLATFLVSALWHGTRPGYYLTFVCAALLQIAGRIYRKKLRPLFVDTKWKIGYDAVCLVATQLSLGFTAFPFIVLDLKPALAAWRSVHFVVPLGALALCLACRYVPKAKK